MTCGLVAAVGFAGSMVAAAVVAGTSLALGNLDWGLVWASVPGGFVVAALYGAIAVWV